MLKCLKIKVVVEVAAADEMTEEVAEDAVIDVAEIDELDQEILSLEAIEDQTDVQNLAVALVVEAIDQNAAKEDVLILDQDQDVLIQGLVLVIQDHQDQDVTDVKKISC